MTVETETSGDEELPEDGDQANVDPADESEHGGDAEATEKSDDEEDVTEGNRDKVSDGAPGDVITDAGAQDNELKLYDFNHPQHRLGAPIPQLDICGVRIALELTEALDLDLHVDADVQMVKSSYQKHSVFIETLSDDTSVFRSDVSPFSLNLLISLERELVVALVDLLFGGSAEASEEPIVRDLSETEKRFAFRLRNSIIESIESVCRDCFRLENHEQAILGAREIATASVENAVLAVQEYSVKARDQEFTFSITFPWTVVGSLSSLLKDESPENENRERKWRSKLREHISASTVELQGKLAETEVTVSQLLDMSRGDFIPLGEVGPATFTIDNTPVFNASVGASNGFVSASILNWTIEGESQNE